MAIPRLVLCLGCICALLHAAAASAVLDSVTLEQAQVLPSPFFAHRRWRPVARDTLADRRLLVYRRTLVERLRSGYRLTPRLISMTSRCRLPPSRTDLAVRSACAMLMSLLLSAGVREALLAVAAQHGARC